MKRRGFLLGLGVGITVMGALARKSTAQILGTPTVAELLRERGIPHELSYHPALNGVLVTKTTWNGNVYESLNFAIKRSGRLVFPTGSGATAETVHVPYGAEVALYSRGKFIFSLAL
ncbi:MAG: hypothetical protein HYZ69_01950 [Candidatus Colwellbacteria bacterium]|nr:hypothetical protein [Candidatus Colwellbacteria bacterium]